MEADALVVLGTVEQRLGRPAEAVDCQLAALDLARRTGIRYSAVEALIGLATVRGSAVDARQALDLARTAGYRALEGRALTTLARLPADRGRALEHARRALEVHRETGHRLDEARTFALLADLAAANGDTATAKSWRARAESAFEFLGIPPL